MPQNNMIIVFLYIIAYQSYAEISNPHRMVNLVRTRFPSSFVSPLCASSICIGNTLDLWSTLKSEHSHDCPIYINRRRRIPDHRRTSTPMAGLGGVCLCGKRYGLNIEQSKPKHTSDTAVGCQRPRVKRGASVWRLGPII